MTRAGPAVFRVLARHGKRDWTIVPAPVDDAGVVDRREKANGAFLAQQMKVTPRISTVVILRDTGHWVMEERPKETTDALMQFL